MTALDEARLTFELHADALTRSLGSGGSRPDMQRAKRELLATQAALTALTAEVAKEAQ